jgi:hypothetical protein
MSDLLIPTAIPVVSAYRPCHNENVTDLNDIDDIRNGMFANVLIHNSFDPRLVVVLNVCRFYPGVYLFSDLRRQHILRLQTVFSKQETYLCATVEHLFRKMSLTQGGAIIRYNGWLPQTRWT